MVKPSLNNCHVMVKTWNAKTSTSRTNVANAPNCADNVSRNPIITGDAKYSLIAPPALVIAVRKTVPNVVIASVSGCKKTSTVASPPLSVASTPGMPAIALRIVSKTPDVVPVSCIEVIHPDNDVTTLAMMGTTVSAMNVPNSIKMGMSASPRVC